MNNDFIGTDHKLGKSRRFYKTLILIAVLGTTLFGARQAKAGSSYTLTLTQVGNDVVGTGRGTINTAGLTNHGPVQNCSFIWPSFPDGSYVETGRAIGSAEQTNVNSWSGIKGSTNFDASGLRPANSVGRGGQTFASSGSGSDVGIVAGGNLYLPPGYHSGSRLSSSATWSHASFDSLGVKPGTYTWKWRSGDTTNSFTLYIDNGVR